MWTNLRKQATLLTSGAVAFGFLQALEMVNFADVITRFLSTFLSLLISVLFGADPQQQELLGGAI